MTQKNHSEERLKQRKLEKQFVVTGPSWEDSLKNASRVKDARPQTTQEIARWLTEVTTNKELETERGILGPYGAANYIVIPRKVMYFPNRSIPDCKVKKAFDCHGLAVVGDIDSTIDEGVFSTKYNWEGSTSRLFEGKLPKYLINEKRDLALVGVCHSNYPGKVLTPLDFKCDPLVRAIMGVEAANIIAKASVSGDNWRNLVLDGLHFKWDEYPTPYVPSISLRSSSDITLELQSPDRYHYRDHLVLMHSYK